MKQIQNNDIHQIYDFGDAGCVDQVSLTPSVKLSYNRIYVSTWPKSEEAFASSNMLIINCSISG